MSLLSIINAVIVMVGLPAIFGACLFIGRKLEVLDSLQLSIDKIKHNVTVISSYLIRYHKQFNPSELKAFSPYQLTDIGQKFIIDMGFDKVFQENKQSFFDCIDSDKPKLKYDVETSAIKCIYALFEKPYMNFLKVFFYNHKDRTMEDTAPTLGVYLRDKYLEIHPEIVE